MSIRKFYDSNHAKLLSYSSGEGLTPFYYARDFIGAITPVQGGDLAHIRLMLCVTAANGTFFTDASKIATLKLNIFAGTFKDAKAGLGKISSSDSIVLNTTNIPLLGQPYLGSIYQFLFWLKFSFDKTYIDSGENYFVQIEKTSTTSTMPNIYILNDHLNPVYYNGGSLNSSRYNSKMEIYIRS